MTDREHGIMVDLYDFVCYVRQLTSAVRTKRVYVVKIESVPILSHSVERVERGGTVKPWKCPEDSLYGVDGTVRFEPRQVFDEKSKNDRTNK